MQPDICKKMKPYIYTLTSVKKFPNVLLPATITEQKQPLANKIKLLLLSFIKTARDQKISLS